MLSRPKFEKYSALLLVGLAGVAFIAFELRGCYEDTQEYVQKWTWPKDKPHILHLYDSINHLQAAYALEDELKEPASEEGFDALISLYREALRVAEGIDRASLARLDDEMPERFEEQYLRGLRMRISGLENHDVSEQKVGNQLLNDFGDFYIEWKDSGR